MSSQTINGVSILLKINKKKKKKKILLFIDKKDIFT